MSNEEVKESSKKTFQQIWAAAFIGTHPKEKSYSRRKAQKLRKRDSKFWAHFLRVVVKHLMLFYCYKKFVLVVR